MSDPNNDCKIAMFYKPGSFSWVPVYPEPALHQLANVSLDDPVAKEFLPKTVGELIPWILASCSIHWEDVQPPGSPSEIQRN